MILSKERPENKVKQKKRNIQKKNKNKNQKFNIIKASGKFRQKKPKKWRKNKVKMRTKKQIYFQLHSLLKSKSKTSHKGGDKCQVFFHSYNVLYHSLPLFLSLFLFVSPAHSLCSSFEITHAALRTSSRKSKCFQARATKWRCCECHCDWETCRQGAANE